jgi:hypothetical protein
MAEENGEQEEHAKQMKKKKRIYNYNQRGMKILNRYIKGLKWED